MCYILCWIINSYSNTRAQFGDSYRRYSICTRPVPIADCAGKVKPKAAIYMFWMTQLSHYRSPCKVLWGA